MFATIARAELRLLLRRRSYVLLLVLFVTLLAVATALGALRQSRERTQQSRYQALVREQWLAQPDRHPHRVAHYGTFAFKPVGPLAAFDPGVESYAGRVQFLEAHRQNAANFAEAASLSSAFRLGELSPAFVLHALLPLLVVVLGHRIVADELETGRSRLLLSQGVGSRTLLAGKAIGLLLALAPFLIFGALAAGAGFFISPPEAAASAGPRLAFVAAMVALHVAGWIALTLWISARARTAVRAMATLVALWAAVCVVLPRGAAALAAALHPLPSKSEFTARLEKENHALGDSHDPNDPVFVRFREETLRRHGVTRIEDLPVNYNAVVMAHGEELSARLFARHFDELTALMERQDKFVRRTALFSPFLAVRALSSAFSGTDLAAHAKFQRDAEAYRYAFVQQLNALHRDKVALATNGTQRLSADHWQAFADFRSTVPSLTAALTGTAWCWIALALWLAVPLIALNRRGGLNP